MPSVRILLITILFICIYINIVLTKNENRLKNESQSIPNGLKRQIASTVIQMNPKKSLAISPLSLRFPLCKLTSVANGETLKELRYTLGLLTQSMLPYCYTAFKNILIVLKETDLSYVNKIYVPYSDDINQNFLVNSSILYGVQVEKIGFNQPLTAVSFINRAINSATLHRIPDMLNKNDITKQTSMIIVNAVHYKGTWEEPFDSRYTKIDKFRHHDNKISNIQMMNKQNHYYHLNDDDYKMLKIKLGVLDTSISFIVPTSVQGLPELMNKIFEDPNFIRRAQSRMKYGFIKVSIPKIKIRSQLDWTEYLKAVGVRTIFDPKSTGLNRILKWNSTRTSISVDKVKQKVFVEIEETGIGRPPDPHEFHNFYTPMSIHSYNVPEFIADRPFYFEVTVNVNSMQYLLICGTYYGP